MSNIDVNALLYVRGFIYLYISVMTLLASLVYVNPDSRLWSWAYRARMFTLALFFFVLALGGLSAYANYPEVGRWAITYGATAAAAVYALLITLFVVVRR